MARRYCTHCLSITKKYYNLKTQYERVKGKFVATDLYRCENCGRYAHRDYTGLRSEGRHIIVNLEHIVEGGEVK